MSTTSLKDKARAAAAESWGDNPAETSPSAGPLTAPEPATPVELPAPTDDPPPVPVHIAWARVMRDVGAIGKRDRVSAGGAGSYNFRGVDRTVNAFGPACRRHGVMVIPTAVRSTHDDARTSSGKTTRETTAIVSWRIYGPLGDFLDGESEGESLDSSDKGTAKAQSIALRVFLLAAGMVPTDEMPDGDQVERGERRTVVPAQYVEEICDPRTSLARLRQIAAEVKRHGIGAAVVQNENGDDEQLLALCTRIGTARRSAVGGEA